MSEISSTKASNEPTIASNQSNSVKSLLDVTKAFFGYPRSSNNFFKQNVSSKGSYTDKSMYVPLYVSIQNLQAGKSVSGSSAVNLVTDSDFDFPSGSTVPKDFVAHDGLISMDIADISQMQRDLSKRLEKIESELKSSDERQNLLLIRDSVKNNKKVSDNLISSLSDSALSDMLKNYNTTIQ